MFNANNYHFYSLYTVTYTHIKLLSNKLYKYPEIYMTASYHMIYFQKKSFHFIEIAIYVQAFNNVET